MKLSKKILKSKKFHKDAYEFIVSIISSCIDKDKVSFGDLNILDFGCGKANLLKRLEEKGIGKNLCGIDIFESLKEIEFARKNSISSNIKNIKPYQDIPFDLKFDVIIANQVFEHIENKNLIFKQIYNCLKDGGLLITTFPTKEIIVEPHLKLPFIHYLQKESYLCNLYLKMAYLLKLGSFNKRNIKLDKYNSLIRTSDYLTNSIFYKNYKWYIDNLNKLFLKTIDISDYYLDSLRKDRIIINIIKNLISILKISFLRRILTRKIFGVFLVCYK